MQSTLELESQWNLRVTLSTCFSTVMALSYGVIGLLYTSALLTRVVHTGLDDVIQSKSSWSLLVPKLAVHLLGQHLGHVIVVLGEVWILLIRFEIQLKVVVGVSERHDCVSGTLERDEMQSIQHSYIHLFFAI